MQREEREREHVRGVGLYYARGGMARFFEGLTEGVMVSEE